MPLPGGSLGGAGIGGPYATRAQVKLRLGIPDSDTSRDTEVDAALATGADTIHRATGRQFGRAEEVSERTFVWGPSGLETDDFWTTDGLLIAEAAYSADTYALEPVNGMRDGVPGWPYEKIAYPYSVVAHPIYRAFRGMVSAVVSAKWGWESVPANVVEANILLAMDDMKSGDAPFGVAGFGDYVVRLRANPRAAEKLAPYVKGGGPLMVGS
jgi:hypothetical protein